MVDATDSQPVQSAGDDAQACGVPAEHVAGSSDDIGFDIVLDEDLRAYLAVANGEELGAITYEVAGDRVILRATNVRPEHQGRAVGTRLGLALLERFRREHKTVLVTCPFMRNLIDKHPEYADVATHAPREA
ncbi:GNAT family N-acetyltransferase [uncultured Arthrobacter sp.]|uniref:GNAT family N-acetyltransferase n=1 Tax=uncultured Arthrobacter sp. TaxID=114050 RepID=UPI0025EA7AC2|nr:GNAT family N-acetyltransferase [uncultured Arthrobacter sp.]